jgi:hypothetical protein
MTAPAVGRLHEAAVVAVATADGEAAVVAAVVVHVGGVVEVEEAVVARGASACKVWERER